MGLFTGFFLRAKTLTSNTTLTGKEDVVYMNCASGAVTATLPSAVGLTGKVLEFIKTETSINNMVISPVLSQTINGMASITLNQAYSSLKLKSNGINWIADWNPIQKQYNMTVTGTTWTTNVAVGVPYQTINGTWRLKFNIDGTVSPARSDLDLSVAGISGRSYYMAINGSTPNSTNISRAWSYGGLMYVYYTSAVVLEGAVSGEIDLVSKPTWAE